MQKISLYFLFVLIFMFIDKPYAMEKEPYSMKLLFQELAFNIPQDRFFVISFNPKNAESRLLEMIDYKTAIEKYGNKLTIGNKVEEIIPIVSSRDNHHSVFYFKTIKGVYEYGIINNQTNKTEIYNSYLLQANPEEISFLNNEGEIISQQYDNKQKKLSIKTDSFIKESINANVYYLFGNCKLQRYVLANSSKELIWRRNSLITEAGLVNSEWGWFSERKNEKMAGHLFFLNLRNFKPVKGPLSVQCKLIAIVK